MQIKYWLGVLAIGLSSILLKAQDSPLSYFFEGKEVVFQFDSRVYKKATEEGTYKELDFADLDIDKVAVSGSFNNWSRKGWRMQKVGPYTYQLRKKVHEFNDHFSNEFKFIINGKYWAEPDERFENRVYANQFWEDVYNLSLYDIEPSPDGNTLFQLADYASAKNVVLTGDFIGWNETHLKMEKGEEGWGLRLELPAGRYEYKFIVDGEWIHDPANPERVQNQYKTYNSVRHVSTSVLFCLEGFASAKKVQLAGSFNNWNPTTIELQKTKSGWELSLPLSGGKHFYKFIVDGKWMVDPDNPYQEYDKVGNLNSVLIVQ